jgi:hypothetical protein
MQFIDTSRGWCVLFGIDNQHTLPGFYDSKDAAVIAARTNYRRLMELIKSRPDTAITKEMLSHIQGNENEN